MTSRRNFLRNVSASISAVLLTGALGAAEGSSHNFNSSSVEINKDASNTFHDKNVLITVRSDEDGRTIGNFLVDRDDNYRAFSVLTPKLGEVLIRVAPTENESMVEITIMRRDGKVINHSYSGLETTQQFYNLGVTLVLGMAPDGVSKDMFTKTQ